uniref:Uncharacterized protein n=1 Tax=Palpitomonas bilix TaxID=652834 RepID=A0A7S3G1X0_9EUKA
MTGASRNSALLPDAPIPKVTVHSTLGMQVLKYQPPYTLIFSTSATYLASTSLAQVWDGVKDERKEKRGTTNQNFYAPDCNVSDISISGGLIPLFRADFFCTS